MPPTSSADEAVDRSRTEFVIVGAVIGNSLASVEIRNGRITAVGDVDPNLPHHSVSGWLTPAAIDAHVHLHYRKATSAMLRGGVAAALDLGAPISTLSNHRSARELLIVGSGPIITAAAGYPTQSWGRDGYGLEIETPDDADQAVDTLAARGARVIKIALAHGPRLSPALARQVVQRAHHHGLLVFAHALSDADAKEAADVGADVLAHTPTEPLTKPTIAAWSDRYVVSTLTAFGGSAGANLTKLHAAGADVVYGTDFGNTTRAGVSRAEIEQLKGAGLTSKAILTAMTATPADLLKLNGFGRITAGARASFILTATDPLADPSALAEPSQVWINGKAQLHGAVTSP